MIRLALWLSCSCCVLFSSSLDEIKSTLSRTENIENQQLHEQALRIEQTRRSLTEIIELPPNELSEKHIQKALEIQNQLKSQFIEYRALQKNLNQEFAYFHETHITLEQFITEYASNKALYIIPQEMAKIPLHLSSSILFHQSSWEHLIEIICLENNIGIKCINPLVKRLYWTSAYPSYSLQHFASDLHELQMLEPNQPVCYVQNFEGTEIEEVHSYLKTFAKTQSVHLHRIQQQILLTGPSSEILQLAKLVEFVKKHQTQKSYKLIEVDPLSNQEIELIISACFQKLGERSSKSSPPLFTLPLKQHLLLMGSQQDIAQAESLLKDISKQVCSPDQMTLYGYQCRYTDPESLASLLQQVYQVISCAGLEEAPKDTEDSKNDPKAPPCNPREGTIPPVCNASNLVVNPSAAKNPSQLPSHSYPNFIIDPKTGLLVMVVKQTYLEHLLQLVKKLDVPKKMVEMEVLLFEKKITDQTQFGLNSLKLGDNVKTNTAQMDWTVPTATRSTPGILNYLFSRKKPGGQFPPFNFAYHFLISQDDICIHSNPTITTVNQTQAVIDLVEEQSINMGTVEDPRTSVITNTFVRAQYGIIIKITPTINYGTDNDDDQHSITLETDITFDTTTSDKNDRPDVSRRHIQNQVRIINGETLILGGLRRKNSETHTDKIPFIGDIPGIGRLFSFTSLDDSTTEMFILITPKIVEEAAEKAWRNQVQEYKKRPGDSPKLLKRILEAKEYEKQKKFASSVKKVFVDAS